MLVFLIFSRNTSFIFARQRTKFLLISFSFQRLKTCEIINYEYLLIFLFLHFEFVFLFGSTQHDHGWLNFGFGCIKCLSTVNPTSWLTWTSSEKAYFCVPQNRQGDKIAISVRYAPVKCSSVHHLFSYEGSFFSFSFFTQSWVWKEELWCKQKGHRGANPSRQSEKEQLQKGLQHHGESYKA